MKENGITPMLKQYFEIKKEYPDAILFFRMGDFYEMFCDDARVAAPILEVVLTSRNKNKGDAVPLCGVPYHAMENYAAKLLKKGFKVAICEQVEDPALAKGLVRREVTHVLTPATALEIESLESGQGTYIVSLAVDDTSLALAALDLAASDFEVKSFPRTNLEGFLNELFRKSPREILLAKPFEAEWRSLEKRLPDFAPILVTVKSEEEFNYAESEHSLKELFRVETIEGLGLVGYPVAVRAAGALIRHLQFIRKTALKNLSVLRFFPAENHLILDAVAFRNLEIVSNLRTGSGHGSLLEAVDFTLTAMGKRLLKRWLSYPLLQIEEIERRQDGVAEFAQNMISRAEVRRTLKSLADLAKLTSKIALNLASPHHLLNLKETLRQIPVIKKEIENLQAAILREITAGLDELEPVVELIERAILEDPAVEVGGGQVIKGGFHLELDELRRISRSAKEIVSSLEKSERQKTGIPSLKIRYNKVFGYFIEVTNTHLKLVPPHYIRKQTLVNAERFLTAELKELEDKILKAEEKIVEIEKSLYAGILAEIQKYAGPLNRNAELIALVDVLAAGGELVQRRNYVRPQLAQTSQILIEDGRHPVLEAGALQRFIPNDLLLNADAEQILIITGPNMGGKSTYLRQNALIVILAQAGYFVPAKQAQIGIVDRIFTRIGAADALLEGKSTFLVEMIEAAIILNNATSRSLILLDEIGRGTSTYDGLSIAWAVIEFLHNLKERPRTLFATHYHELTELGNILERVKNLHISVKEWQDSVIFLHKVVAGASDQSFGIHVAKIAGIPVSVIDRAKEILLNLEKKELNRLVKERVSGRIKRIPANQKELFPEDMELKIWDEIRKGLQETDISRLTPLEALNILHFLKHKSESLE